ncbi:amidase domain-containing protein [Bacillus sp. AM 13(2015)]|nr:amidase domain-containing protein [Bacillus sp. AM 13(2015)]KUR60284.1 hypothetical protein AOQ70_17430 [Bacillus sp. AM 13(2015)]
MKFKIFLLGFSVTLFILLLIPTQISASEITDEFPLDNYRVEDGQNEVLNYLKDNGLDYPVGSKGYVEFLNSISSLKVSAYNQRLMSAYAGIYLMEQENYYFNDNNHLASNNKENFKLNKSVLRKTIEDFRKENEQKNIEIEKKISEYKLVNEITGQQVVTAASSNFNRTKAKKYINDNWNKTANSRFGYFGGSGGDCTNYVSQVIYAGGKKMNYTGKTGVSQFSSNTKGWYSSVYSSSTGNWSTILYSTSWVRVVDFYAYWSRTSKVYNGLNAKQVAKKVSTGDVIQAYNKDNGGWYHTMVVYDVKNGETRYSGHSKAHKYAHLSYEFKGKGYKFRVIKM